MSDDGAFSLPRWQSLHKSKAPVASKRMAGAGPGICAALLVRLAQRQLDWTQRTFDAATSVAQFIMGEAEASSLCLCGYRLRPQPLPWRDIPDPAIDAERRIIIGQEDCGPVWLYNGILNGWHPDQSMELLDRIKLRHWRRGLWPHWYFAQMRNLAISY